MFIANFNVFIALIAGSAYLLSWLLGIPLSGFGPQDAGRLMMPLALIAAVLIAIWTKWRLVPPTNGLRQKQLQLAGHVGVLLANMAFAGGIAMCIQAAAISREDAYWSWVAMLDISGPIGATCFAVSAMLIVGASVARATAPASTTEAE